MEKKNVSRIVLIETIKDGYDLDIEKIDMLFNQYCKDFIYEGYDIIKPYVKKGNKVYCYVDVYDETQ